jgi:excisionase family DNA binding protein
MPQSIYEVKDIMRIMRVSRNTAYKMIQHEGIPFMRVGGHYKIPVERFHRWLDSQFAHLQGDTGCDIVQM